MDTIIAGCKVNLGLRITGRRADGYHELDSLFWPLPEPHDTLELRPGAGPGLTVRCDAPEVDPRRNTLTKAYAALADAVGELPGVEVALRKGIPSGAGLGGGSSDAAALLRALNKRLARPLDAAALSAVALRAGADTPFFLQTSPCRVRGIGDILEPADAALPAGAHLVLVCPPVHSSTPQAYAAYDATPAAAAGGRNVLTKSDVKANGFFLSTARSMPDLHNDLEAVVFSRHPQLAAIKAELLRLGAAAAAMSGSGSAIVALFAPEDGAAACAAARALQRENRRVYTHAL